MCIFCGQPKTIDHLFVQCPIANTLWKWLGQYDNFIFYGISIEDLWHIDGCIPFKDLKLCELIRSVFLWVIWLERNRLIFKGVQVKVSEI